MTRVGYEAGGGRFRDVVDVAAAVELAQLATLVVDDVIDRSETRNGPSVLSVFGEGIGLLTGEILKTSASSLMNRALQVGTSFRNQLEAARYFEQMYQRICVGQLLDLWYESSPDISERQYVKMVGLTTGGFLEGAVVIGSTLSNTAPRLARRLRTYARSLGIAFQIYDDVLDLFPQPGQIKPFASDIKRRKQRLPLVHFLQNCSPKERKEVRQSFREAEITDDTAKELVRLMRARGSIDYALCRARAFCSHARSEALKVAPSANRDLLTGLVELIQEDDPEPLRR